MSQPLPRVAFAAAALSFLKRHVTLHSADGHQLAVNAGGPAGICRSIALEQPHNSSRAFRNQLNMPYLPLVKGLGSSQQTLSWRLESLLSCGNGGLRRLPVEGHIARQRRLYFHVWGQVFNVRWFYHAVSYSGVMMLGSSADTFSFTRIRSHSTGPTARFFSFLSQSRPRLLSSLSFRLGSHL